VGTNRLGLNVFEKNAEDFFASSTSANLAGKKGRTGNFTIKGALPLVLRAFFVWRKIYVCSSYGKQKSQNK
jgi:hypothetical protein